MRRPLLNFAPIGRLHEPLLALAARVHRAMGTHPRSIWTDAMGGVFLDHVARLPSAPPRSLIGTYDKATPVLEIQVGLRLALRARAQQWITDWNTHQLGVSHRQHQSTAGASQRARPRRARIAIMGMPLRSAEAHQPPALAH